MALTVLHSAHLQPSRATLRYQLPSNAPAPVAVAPRLYMAKVKRARHARQVCSAFCSAFCSACLRVFCLSPGLLVSLSRASASLSVCKKIIISSSRASVWTSAGRTKERSRPQCHARRHGMQGGTCAVRTAGAGGGARGSEGQRRHRHGVGRWRQLLMRVPRYTSLDPLLTPPPFRRCEGC